MKKRTCVPCYGKINQRLEAKAVVLIKQGKIKDANAATLASLVLWGKHAEFLGFDNLAERIHRKTNYLMNGAVT